MISSQDVVNTAISSPESVFLYLFPVCLLFTVNLNLLKKIIGLFEGMKNTLHFFFFEGAFYYFESSRVVNYAFSGCDISVIFYLSIGLTWFR